MPNVCAVVRKQKEKTLYSLLYFIVQECVLGQLQYRVILLACDNRVLWFISCSYEWTRPPLMFHQGYWLIWHQRYFQSSVNDVIWWILCTRRSILRWVILGKWCMASFVLVSVSLLSLWGDCGWCKVCFASVAFLSSAGGGEFLTLIGSCGCSLSSLSDSMNDTWRYFSFVNSKTSRIVGIRQGSKVVVGTFGLRSYGRWSHEDQGRVGFLSMYSKVPWGSNLWMIMRRRPWSPWYPSWRMM